MKKNQSVKKQNEKKIKIVSVANCSLCAISNYADVVEL